MAYFSRFFIFLSVCVFLAPSFVDAAQASLSLAPKDGTYVAGNEFTVGVVLDTGGVAVNAVEGKIRYLPDDLQIVRIDTGGSPVTSWTVAPDHTTEPGLISFGGINPDGISGKGKTICSVTFRVVRSGEARVRLVSGAAILAEGGAGTNILTDLRGGTYTLQSSDDQSEAVHGGPSPLRSSSHPDEGAWYKYPDVSFEWSRSPNTDQARFSVDQNSEGAPTGNLPGATEGKAMMLGEGVWYGHLALHDDSGWSPIGHLRVQIDTGRPESLRVLEIPRGNPEDPRPTISLEASDARSGISHYEIAMNGGSGVRWEDDGNHRYQFPALSPGDHVVSVRVFDRAGNSVTETLVVRVEGLPLPLLQPIPSALLVGGEIDLEGTVGEGMTARVSIGFDGGESRTEDIASGPGGAFIHTFVFPQEGVYRLRTQAIDQRGATSEWTPEVSVRVSPRSFLGAIGSIGGGGGGILASLVFLVSGILIGLWYGKNTVRVGALAPLPRMESRSLVSPVVSVLEKVREARNTLFTPRKQSVSSGAFPAAVAHEREENQKLSGYSSSAPSSSVEERREDVLRSSHTVSLRKKISGTPPHSPTILGR